VARDLGDLPDDTRRKVVCDNVAKLYDFEIPTHVSTVEMATTLT
jgi:hypothetical protein